METYSIEFMVCCKAGQETWVAARQAVMKSSHAASILQFGSGVKAIVVQAALTNG